MQYQVASQSGLNVGDIEQAQQEKATDRMERLELKTKVLQKKIKILALKKAA